MNTREMKYEFLVISEAIANKSAPGYTDREISTLFTIAQEEFILDKLSSLNPATKDTVEETEKVGQELGLTIVTGTIRPTTIGNTGASIRIADNGLSNNSYFIEIPDGIYYILHEELHRFAQASNLTTRTVGTYSVYKIKPISHGFYDANKNNPFKRPCGDELWRMRFSKSLTTRTGTQNFELFEIIFPDSIDVGTAVNNKTFYRLRYIERPTPIIIPSEQYNMFTSETLEGITLKGTSEHNCKLKPIAHRAIVKRAADTAKAYTDDSKGLQMQQLLEDVKTRERLNK